MSSGPRTRLREPEPVPDLVKTGDGVPAGVAADHGEGHRLPRVDHAAGAVGGVVGSNDQQEVRIRDDFIQGIGESPVQDFDNPLFDTRILGMGGDVRGLGMDVDEIIPGQFFGQTQAVPKIGLRVFGVLNGPDRHSQVLAQAAIQGAGGDGQGAQ